MPTVLTRVDSAINRCRRSRGPRRSFSMGATVRFDISVKVKSGMMLIKELAHRCGVSTRALRHYDSLGLLSSRRLGNGYRDFEECAVEQVRRIRLLLDVGLDLQAVALLLPCFTADGALTACSDARERLRAQICDVDGSIAQLRRTRELLAGTLDSLVEG